jgi:cupin fold WbuC family metalloprotein
MKRYTKQHFEDLITKAAGLDRKRANLNIHEDPSDPVQRLFIATHKDSYFRPHRHPHIWEFALIIKGAFDLILFDDTGMITDRFPVGPETDVPCFELPEGMWHTWVPLTENALFFETKKGPYDPLTISEFAPWSPAEGSSGVEDYVARLKNGAVGDRVTINE